MTRWRRVITIRYAPTQNEGDRHHAENHLRDLIQATLGNDVLVVFEEIAGDEYWQQTRVRITGWWDTPKDIVFEVIAALLSEAA